MTIKGNQESPCSTMRIIPEDLSRLKPIQDLVARCAAGDDSARVELNQLGVLRTKGSPMGDYAEWLVEQLFGLKRALSTIQKGWDVKDKDGRRYQIKARPYNPQTSWDHNTHPDFDYFIALAFRNETFDLLLMLCISYEDFCELCSGKRPLEDCRLRWARVRNDPRITTIYSAL